MAANTYLYDYERMRDFQLNHCLSKDCTRKNKNKFRMQSLDTVPTFSGRFRETYVIKPVQLEQITQNFCYTVNDGSNEKVVEQIVHPIDDELPSTGAPLNELPSNGAVSVTLSDEEKTFLSGSDGTNAL